MNALRTLAAGLLCPLALTAAPVFQFTDDFSRYPDDSDAAPRWEVNDIGFAVHKGSLHADVQGQRGVAIVKDTPAGKDLMIEAKVTPMPSPATNWRTAGIGVMIDERNFWHIALAESPDGSKRFAELSEMLDGVWNAQGEPETRLTVVEETGPFEWNYGSSYRLRLTLAHENGQARIHGEIFEGETSRYRCVRALDRKAVDHGRPALTVNTLPADFDDVVLSIDTLAPSATTATTAAFPAFHSSPLATGKRLKAGGFFRVEQTAGAWWLVDPAGAPMLSIGTDHVSYQGHWCESLGFAPYHRIVEKKFGGEKAWADDAVRRLREWNFTSLGTNPSPLACHIGLPHTEAIQFGSTFSGTAALVEKTTWTGFPDVFDPRFERFCDLRARQFCAPRRDDPWLLGYYLDNELEWWGKSHQPQGLAVDAAKLPASAAGKAVLVASLRRSFGNDVAALNAAFGSSISSFEQLLPPFDLPQPANDRARAALDAFVAEVAERYFRITTAAVRRHDPHHLLLGCRFAHDAPESAWRQAGSTCDVVTVNVYPRVDLASAEVIGLKNHLEEKFKLCHRPMILTEWGFPSLDAVDRDGKPLPCTQGAGMRVDTVDQKARCYAAVQRTLFALPFMVGSHYFMWADEPSLGISKAFPENSSYGLVNETDDAYAPLVRTATRVNARLHDLHVGRIRSAEIDPGNAEVSARTTPQVATVGNRVLLERSAAGYVIDTGALRAVKDQPGDAIFNRIQWRASDGAPWTDLGSFTCVLNTLRGTLKDWPHPDQTPEVSVVTQTMDSLVIDVTCRRAANPAFSTCQRLTFQGGRPYFETRMLWIDNTGDSMWTLGGYLHYLPSNVGGETANDAPGIAGVPNYWLKIATWRDPGLALNYGVLVPNNDARMECNFWKDSVQHPDCMRKIGSDLAPRQRWNADSDEPAAMVFGLQETPDNPRPWRALPHPARK